MHGDRAMLCDEYTRSDGAEPIAGEPVPGQGRRLRQRRQLRGGRGHGAGRGRVAAERHHGSTGERAAQLPARLVQGAPQRHRLPLATRCCMRCCSSSEHAIWSYVRVQCSYRFLT
jgi:hypothetical protein